MSRALTPAAEVHHLGGGGVPLSQEGVTEATFVSRPRRPVARLVTYTLIEPRRSARHVNMLVRYVTGDAGVIVMQSS